MSTRTNSIAAKSVASRFCTALVLSTFVWLGGLPRTEAGVDAWTPIGPNGGTVNSLATDTRTGSLYATVFNTGVFRSTDGGGSWSAGNSGLPYVVGFAVRSLAIDPQIPTTLYATVVAAGDPSASWAGVYKSTDGGESWSQTPTPIVGEFNTVAIDPLTPTTVYSGSGRDGVFKSTDGGASWSDHSTGLTHGGGWALAIDPQTPTTLYTTGDYSRESQRFEPAGVFKSTDGGSSWTQVNTGLTNLHVHALAIDPQTPSTVYAGTRGGGVFRSTDGGGTWSAVNTGLTSLDIITLAIDRQTPSTLYAGTYRGGVFKSTEAGSRWSALNTGLTTLDVIALAIDPQTPTTIYAATFNGVFAFQQTPGSEYTTVNFDSPPPPGEMNGVFEGIDFGTGQWQLSGGFDVDGTNHIYFGDSTGTSRSFQFSPAPRVLNGIRVYTTTKGTLTLSDDAGQTLTQEVPTGSLPNGVLQVVVTGWTRPSTTVTVSFTSGWELGVDDITYRTAP